MKDDDFQLLRGFEVWGIQKAAVIKLNSINMLLSQNCVSEFVLVLVVDNFSFINFFCSTLLLSAPEQLHPF